MRKWQKPSHTQMGRNLMLSHGYRIYTTHAHMNAVRKNIHLSVCKNKHNSQLKIVIFLNLRLTYHDQSGLGIFKTAAKICQLFLNYWAFQRFLYTSDSSITWHQLDDTMEAFEISCKFLELSIGLYKFFVFDYDSFPNFVLLVAGYFSFSCSW